MEADQLQPGTLVDRRYVVHRFLAAGGVSEVYAATHRITGRNVALKRPRADRVNDPIVLERLSREARALARARHPGVVELIDASEHEGVPYLALELLEGRTLGGLLTARGKLAWEEVTRIGLMTAEIAAHCHACGVYHRDIKPDNIFMLPAGTPDVKLFDFGIAELSGAAAESASTKLTHAGSILGTPEYMAPEALRADSRRDHRVDIYALGVVMFELLTGSVPFEGHYGDVLLKVTTKPLPQLKDARADVPASLVAVIERCLVKEPAERFQQMTDVARALRDLEGSREIATLSPAKDAAQGAVDTKHTVADSPMAFRQVRPVAAPVKRRFPRAPYTTPTELKLASGETISGRIEEISEGGLQLIAPRGVKSGERGEFRFAEPITGKVVKLAATSRWTKEARAGRHAVGFEFDGPPEEVRQSIRNYVSLMGGT